MTPKEEETVSADLQKMQEDLYAYGQKMEADMAAKQQKEMEPILAKVNTAIQDVAKEGNFQYIFDAQSGVILYADESSDVTKLVKAKLGIQ
ncbi:MAG: OmpH family outer membrane protein [Saprospiraceae bacterium]|nr:OmpH family outer membrane protein [Saprospiraceae bacterium]